MANYYGNVRPYKDRTEFYQRSEMAKRAAATRWRNHNEVKEWQSRCHSKEEIKQLENELEASKFQALLFVGICIATPVIIIISFLSKFC